MGGFILFDPDQKDRDPDERIGVVLTFDYFKEHPEIDSHIPEITASEIEDKSKGDALSKVIAILQTTWFIVQCIARWQQRLALTELELVTLALASLNAVTFGIWWYKPLGVQEPVKIYVKNTGIPEVDNAPRNVGVISWSLKLLRTIVFRRIYRLKLSSKAEKCSKILGFS